MTRKHYFLFLFLLTTFITFAQINPTRIAVSQIPREIQYIAKVEDAMSWKDSTGSCMLVLTETGEHVSHSGESFGKDAELHAYCYVKRGSTYVPVWTMHDFIKECQTDISAEYISNAASFTDLDRDGVAEVWLIYRTACRGDVSPATQKIVM